MPYTKSEINAMMDELNAAIFESLDADKLEEDGKKAVIKARKRLQMAREAINGIKFRN